MGLKVCGEGVGEVWRRCEWESKQLRLTRGVEGNQSLSGLCGPEGVWGGVGRCGEGVGGIRLVCSMAELPPTYVPTPLAPLPSPSNPPTTHPSYLSEGY